MRVVVGANCIPCKQLKQWLAEQNFEIEQIVAEDNMELAQELGVRALPTLVLDDNTLIKGSEAIMEYLKKDDEDE